MESTTAVRLRFELWKFMQVWHAPELLQKQQHVIAKPIYRAAALPRPPPVDVPAVAAVVDTLLSPPPVAEFPKRSPPKKSSLQVTLDHLLAFKEKHEKMPFVLAWNIVYQYLILGSSSKLVGAMKKINTQEKLEDELISAGVMEHDMVDIEGLIALLNLRGDQPKKRRPSMI
ncbi:hypothetical protein H310_03711 [Aphanomyces invadans]|uniref:Uncharacterized protein n=1 Tax=Aphanomyces invadans TaxID=157072 RepID=A0A024UIJ1_9STRA|nr:hypothetical protein H310_03711 [Aphanomyces invadans]ETW06119.1 hypothetical protein H310_03711 [Aphanomyces invadans]|eukprot:XP_008865896.1 hypothetical protein H310_03711 [Aphanomyces invadans]